jgi:hypothetical protein
MALSSRLNQPPRSVHGSPCSIGTLLATLTGGELEAFKTMLGSTEWNATAIYDAVRDEGYEIGRQSINRHRRGACRCYRDAA